ncbi:hypothetical protein [Curtobacterium pusillum]|uniref:hypothetical protein n=1 Tax=Curtobacterium pusillum TaxID=69373 RepID=UPI0011AA229E|nr:hypothetical protein [Curtobacterium pusillum]
MSDDALIRPRRRRRGRRLAPVVLFWGIVLLLVVVAGAAVSVPAYLGVNDLAGAAGRATASARSAATDLKNAKTGADVARQALTDGLNDGSIPTPAAVWVGAIAAGEPLPPTAAPEPGYSFAVGRVTAAEQEVADANRAYLASKLVSNSTTAAYEVAHDRYILTLSASIGAVVLVALIFGTFLMLNLPGAQRRR